MKLRIDEEIELVPSEVIHFKSDEEFTDFCLAPYGVLANGTYTGKYTEIYLDSLKEGKHFMIEDENSQVYKRKEVSKRVPIIVDGLPRGRQRTAVVSLPVENLEDYDFYLFKQRAKQRHALDVNSYGK